MCHKLPHEKLRVCPYGHGHGTIDQLSIRRVSPSISHQWTLLVDQLEAMGEALYLRWKLSYVVLHAEYVVVESFL